MVADNISFRRQSAGEVAPFEGTLFLTLNGFETRFWCSILRTPLAGGCAIESQQQTPSSDRMLAL